MEYQTRPALDEVLALDLLCLRAPDGGPLHPETHREQLAQSLPRAEWACLRRDQALIAYFYLWPQTKTDWFVGGLAIHPDHRTAPVIAGLWTAMGSLVQGLHATTLRSHVLRTNAASLRLHHRLGFMVEQENERAIAFVGTSAELFASRPALIRRQQATRLH